MSGSGFRALFAGSLVSNLGDGIRLAAVPLLAASLTSSEFLISAVTAAQYLAWLTFGPAGGALVDRLDRRRIILVTQAVRGLVIGGLAYLVLSSQAAIWQLCIVAFAITVGEILVDPATIALVPTLVPDEDLDRANSQISAVEIATNDFAGGPIGSALFGIAPWMPFAVNSLSYLGSVGPFRALPRSPDSRQRRGDGPAGTGAGPVSQPTSTTLRADFGEGLTWLRRHRVLGPLTIGWIIYFYGVATSLSLLVVLVTSELDAPGAAFGVVLAVGAFGAFLGTLVGGAAAKRVGVRATVAGAGALQAATLALAALAPSLLALAVAWLVNGFGAGIQRPVSRTLWQRLTPNHLLGRVNVTTRIFTRGVIVPGALIAGAIANASNVRAAFVAAGVSQLIAAAVQWNALGRGPLQRPS